ncbi:MAG: DUF72 domain-containing protein [Gemmatimonadales bacterium]
MSADPMGAGAPAPSPRGVDPVRPDDDLDSPPTPAEIEGLAGRLPAEIRFGTSTWTYPGWTGLVYARPYPERGRAAAMLAEYARFPLFRTVGIDSSFYGPPSAKTLGRWARALPAGFEAVSKVWDRITVHTFADARDRARAGQENPDFLNAELFLREVLDPYRAHFGDHVGPFVFEFQTISSRNRFEPERFAEWLDRFFGRLPADARYAVEVRNEEFLSAPYFAVLREHDVAHVFSSWTRMPTIGEQLDRAGSVPARFLVARALLRPGRSYDEAVDRFAPYDRIRERNGQLRGDLARLARTAVELRIPAFLLVNNRAEGSAPLTIRAVARMLAEPPGA